MKKMKTSIVLFLSIVVIFNAKSLRKSKDEPPATNKNEPIDWSKLEAPTFVPTPQPKPDPFDFNSRLLEKVPQSITSNSAYDVVYPNLKAYYDDRRYIIFDKNFSQVEGLLMNQFKSAIDGAVETAKGKITSVEDFDKRSINLKGMASNMDYDKLQTNDPSQEGKVIYSDPFAVIHGGNFK